MQEKNFVLNIENQEIIVTYKKIKNIRLTIKPDASVILSAPKFVGKKFIIEFIKSKIDWIKLNKEKIINKQQTKQLFNLKTITILGKAYPLKIISAQKNKVLMKDDFIIFSKDLTETSVTKIFNSWAKKELKKLLPGYFEKWQNITNLKASSVKIRDMKTRWGSCNIKTKAITINLQIIKKPIQCLEYLILHELAHIKEKNHDKNFKNLLSSYMPNWKIYRKMLKE